MILTHMKLSCMNISALWVEGTQDSVAMGYPQSLNPYFNLILSCIQQSSPAARLTGGENASSPTVQNTTIMMSDIRSFYTHKNKGKVGMVLIDAAFSLTQAWVLTCPAALDHILALTRHRRAVLQLAPPNAPQAATPKAPL